MDIQYLLLLQAFREAIGGCLNSFLAFITTIAVDYYIAVPALILFWAVDKRKGAQVLGTWGTALCGNSLLKSIFCVYRPWIRNPELQPLPEVMAGATGYSFPSGHSSSASSFYFALVSVYRKYKGLCIFFVVMVALTMFSRNYVGVHTPQDVVVGASIGALSAWTVSKIYSWIDRNPEKDWIILVCACVICACVIAYTALKSYPMNYVDGQLLVDPRKMTVDSFKDPGRFFGIIVGWYLERRFVRFNIDGTAAQKVLRCLVGGILYVLYCTAFCDPLGKAINIGPIYFLLQASAPILFMTLYPLAFSRLQVQEAPVNYDALSEEAAAQVSGGAGRTAKQQTQFIITQLNAYHPMTSVELNKLLPLLKAGKYHEAKRLCGQMGYPDSLLDDIFCEVF